MPLKTSLSRLAVATASSGALLLSGCEAEGTASKPPAGASSTVSPTAAASNTTETCRASLDAQVIHVQAALAAVGKPDKHARMRAAYATLATDLEVSAGKATDSSLDQALAKAAKAAAAASRKPKPEVKDPQFTAAAAAIESLCTPKSQ